MRVIKNFLVAIAAALAVAFSVMGCASLLRDDDPTPEIDAGVDAPVPPAPDACEPPDAPLPPPPSCSCDDDCDRGESCHHGACYERCKCDDDCDRGEECRWGLCKLR